MALRHKRACARLLRECVWGETSTRRSWCWTGPRLPNRTALRCWSIREDPASRDPYPRRRRDDRPVQRRPTPQLHARKTCRALARSLSETGALPCVQRCRPYALQRVADLLDLADRLGERPFAAGPQVPQPAPGLIQWFGDVAAELRGQPRDQYSVLLISLVEGQVLAAPRPRSKQGLHTHERYPAVGLPSPTPTPDPTPDNGTSAAP
jgi:hypothetical protein